MTAAMLQLLSPARLTEIVDVGANPIDGAPPYASMLAAGACRVTGFEPQEEALLKLEKGKGHNERYLPYAIGDGGRHTLNVCRSPGMTSLLEPDPTTLELFDYLKSRSEIARRIPVQTHRLDAVPEIEVLDFLKMDVQGSELAVVRGGAAKLSQAVAVQTEVSFVTLYRNQPAFGDIDLELRGRGFIPHCFAGVKHWPIAPFAVVGEPKRAVNQLLEADIVYVRDFSRPDSMTDEQLVGSPGTELEFAL